MGSLLLLEGLHSLQTQLAGSMRHCTRPEHCSLQCVHLSVPLIDGIQHRNFKKIRIKRSKTLLRYSLGDFYLKSTFHSSFDVAWKYFERLFS